MTAEMIMTGIAVLMIFLGGVLLGMFVERIRWNQAIQNMARTEKHQARKDET